MSKIQTVLYPNVQILSSTKNINLQIQTYGLPMVYNPEPKPSFLYSSKNQNAASSTG